MDGLDSEVQVLGKCLFNIFFSETIASLRF